MRTSVFARIDLYTQLTTLLLQGLVTGHLMKRLGVHVTLALVPAIVALGFVGLAIVASLAALVVLQAAFSAMQRAIIRPARETLFTVVPREDKYKAKAFIDTFVYRVGDVVGAQVEGLPVADPAHHLRVRVDGGHRIQVVVGPVAQHEPGCFQTRQIPHETANYRPRPPAGESESRRR